MKNKTWKNKEGLKARIGFCPYHLKAKLDEGGLCDECLKEIINRAKRR